MEADNESTHPGAFEGGGALYWGEARWRAPPYNTLGTH